MVAGPGLEPKLRRYWGRGMAEPRGASWGLEQCSRRSGRYLTRTATEAPETRIYFTTHRSGAFPVLRVRTVVRGERASQSIVNSLTALWSIGVVSSLILAGLGYELIFT